MRLPTVAAPRHDPGPNAIYDAAGQVGRLTGGSRRCACGKGRRIGVRWETGVLTFECDRFIRKRDADSFEIDV